MKNNKIQFENRLRDLAHEIVIIFEPEISEGSYVFQAKKERVVKKLFENLDLYAEIKALTDEKL